MIQKFAKKIPRDFDQTTMCVPRGISPHTYYYSIQYNICIAICCACPCGRIFEPSLTLFMCADAHKSNRKRMRRKLYSWRASVFFATMRWKPSVRVCVCACVPLGHWGRHRRWEREIERENGQITPRFHFVCAVKLSGDICLDITHYTSYPCHTTYMLSLWSPLLLANFFRIPRPTANAKTHLNTLWSARNYVYSFLCNVPLLVLSLSFCLDALDKSLLTMSVRSVCVRYTLLNVRINT